MLVSSGSVSSPFARLRAIFDRSARWLRYEAIYLWPALREVATFNVGLLPVDEAVAAHCGASTLASNIQVYAELARTARSFADNAEPLTAVEIGCGRGGGLVYLNASLPCPVGGLERSSAAVRFARRRGRDVKRGSATRMPFGNASLDLVFSAEMLFIFGETERAFQELARTLKPGGRVIAADFRLGRIDAVEGHVRDLAQRHGFAVRQFEDFTQRAQRSIIEGEPERRRLLNTVPRLFHADLPNMLSLAGSRRHGDWVEGRRSYFLTVLERLP